MKTKAAEPRYGYDSSMGLIFDGTDCLTMKEVARRLNYLDVLERKIAHGCTDANCSLCDKAEPK